MGKIELLWQFIYEFNNYFWFVLESEKHLKLKMCHEFKRNNFKVDIYK